MDVNPSALLSLLGMMLVCPCALTDRGSSKPHMAEIAPMYKEQEEERPRVVRSAMQSCGSDQQSYCFNNGHCMLLVDNNKYHCKCERGFYGPRCAHLELVFQPMREEHLVLIIVCVVLLIIGLTGALYLLYQWYRRNKGPRQQKRQGYKGVETA